jgi:hypothetical protein
VNLEALLKNYPGAYGIYSIKLEGELRHAAKVREHERLAQLDAFCAMDN